MWERESDRLAILELYHTRRLRRRNSQAVAWSWLSELPWTRRTSRQKELVLVDSRRRDVERLLTQVWPEWRAAHAHLMANDLPVSEQGWRTLLDQQRANMHPRLPNRLNRRTAAAQVGPHSKAGMSVIRQQALAEVDVTRDGLVRLRPSPGLRIRGGGHDYDAAQLASVCGEVVITERALNAGTVLAGERPRAVLLVENLGPYLDLTAPRGWLVAHVPGWNTTTIRVLFEQLDDVRVVHFGDLDPNGVRIAMHLRAHRQDLRWAVPEFWRDWVPDRALPGEWPEELDVSDAPRLVQELAAHSCWLEQEGIVLDSRLTPALEASLE